MKIKVSILILLVFLSIGKINAQTNNDEAVATYQLAQEKFDKGQYKEALTFLDKVDQLNPAAKTKTSYLKAKCAYKYSLESSHQNFLNDSIVYNYCLYYIKYYFDNGKDEDKKSELLKMKIEVENSEGFKNYLSTVKNNKLKNELLYEKNKLLFDKYENMSSTDALTIINNIIEQNPRPVSDLVGKWEYGFIGISFPKECFIQITDRFLYTTHYGMSVGHLDIYTFWLSSVYIDIVNNQSITVKRNNNDPIQKIEGHYYCSLKEFIKICESDIQNYKNGKNKTHAFEGYKKTTLDSINLSDFCKISISDDDKTNLRMAFNVLIKNCGGGVKK